MSPGDAQELLIKNCNIFIYVRRLQLRVASFRQPENTEKYQNKLPEDDKKKQSLSDDASHRLLNKNSSPDSKKRNSWKKEFLDRISEA